MRERKVDGEREKESRRAPRIPCRATFEYRENLASCADFILFRMTRVFYKTRRVLINFYRALSAQRAYFHIYRAHPVRDAACD